jgi:hypothetical protein
MNDIESVVLVETVRHLLPNPVREDDELPGEVVLVGGEPGEVIVQICRNKVLVSVYGVRWDGPHTLVLCPQHLATLNYKQLSAATIKSTLHQLIGAASELRRAQYRKCKRCNETKPPEWMHGDDICQSCAEQHCGVVY